MQYNRKALLDSVNFVLRASGDIITFAPDVIQSSSLYCAIQTHCKHDLKGSVKASDFHDVLYRMMADQIDISMDEGHMNIKAGKAKAKLQLLTDDVVFPSADCTEPLPDDFFTGLTNCIVPKVKYDWEGVTISDGHMFSTIGAMLNVCKLADQDCPDFWINTVSANVLYGIGNVFTHIGFNKQWIVFKTISGDHVALLKLNMEQYPTKKSLEYMTSCDVLQKHPIPVDLIGAIERAYPMADTIQSSLVVSLTFDGNKCIVSTKKGKGEYEEEIPCADIGQYKHSFDVRYLSYVLKRSKEFYVDEKRRFVAWGDKNFHLLIGMV